MRKYKAVVVDLKKIAKAGALVLLGAAVAAGAFRSMGKRLSATDASDKVLRNNIPIMHITASDGRELSDYIKQGAEALSDIFPGYLPTDTKSVLSSTIPIYAKVSEKEIALLGGEEKVKSIHEEYDDRGLGEEEEGTPDSNIPEENRAVIKSIDAAQRTAEGMPVAIGNETSYSIDINSMLSQRPEIDMSGEGPKVLITHTHATESYAEEEAEFYDVTASDRSEDTSKNVVAVGKRLAEVLESHGIETIHDTILHDAPSFNGSYAHSLSTVTEYMQKHPSIQVVFDIHRDSIVYDDNTKAKTLTDINGREAVQLMFVVGTDEKGLHNPDWRENMNAAIHFQTAITEKYPKLMRHINLRQERFNGHTSHASMIIEAGTSGNSLSEALVGIEAAGECIADYLNSL